MLDQLIIKLHWDIEKRNVFILPSSLVSKVTQWSVDFQLTNDNENDWFNCIPKPGEDLTNDDLEDKINNVKVPTERESKAKTNIVCNNKLKF